MVKHCALGWLRFYLHWSFCRRIPYAETENRIDLPRQTKLVSYAFYVVSDGVDVYATESQRFQSNRGVLGAQGSADRAQQQAFKVRHCFQLQADVTPQLSGDYCEFPNP